jgi:uncharacterized membrane protein YjgN (DUF898 family)
MKVNFTCSLRGALWYKPLFEFFILFLAILIPFEFMIINLLVSETGINIFFLACAVVLFIALSLLSSAYLIRIADIVYPLVSIKREAFAFTGDIRAFIKINLAGLLLSLITLGFYFPWYAKKNADYLLSNSLYKGEKSSFGGQPGQLLVYSLLSFLLPLLAWSIVFIKFVASTVIVSSSSRAGESGFYFLVFLLFIVLFFIMVPFAYLFQQWCMDIKWKNIHITRKTELWPSILFIAGQLLLCILTFGVYVPVFYIKYYRFFIEKTILETDGKEKYRLGFEGNAKKGFFLLLGQALLSIITLGIYLPWAYASCLRYFINGTYIENTPGYIRR